jgi:hypothetical protein
LRQYEYRIEIYVLVAKSLKEEGRDSLDALLVRLPFLNPVNLPFCRSSLQFAGDLRIDGLKRPEKSLLERG